MSEPIVAQEVTKSFARDGERVEVLKGVSLAVAAGELVSIVGPTGEFCWPSGILRTSDTTKLRLSALTSTGWDLGS